MIASAMASCIRFAVVAGRLILNTQVALIHLTIIKRNEASIFIAD